MGRVVSHQVAMARSACRRLELGVAVGVGVGMGSRGRGRARAGSAAPEIVAPGRGSLLTTYHNLLLTTYYLPEIVAPGRGSLLTTYYNLLLTTYYLLLT